MIGYLIEQELGNLLPLERPLATLLTMIEVDGDDPAFANPTKPIGPVYEQRRGRPARGGEGLGIQARRRQLPPGGAVADSEADLRASPDQDAARTGRGRDLRRRRRNPDPYTDEAVPRDGASKASRR